MARQRHLSRAPLREALIDLQFETRLSMASVDQFVESLTSTYEKKLDLWEAVLGLSFSGAEARSTHTAVGRRLESRTAPPYVLQVRVSGFTLSRLSPYGSWEDLQSEARRLFSSLVEQAGPFTISRVAVRYINELKLPLPLIDFGDYLVSPPKVPDSLPQAITGFLTRTVIPDDVANCVAIVTQAMEGPPSEGSAGAFVTVLLDVDVFRPASISATDDHLWSVLSTLRDQKNRMFFEHVTEKMAERYE